MPNTEGFFGFSSDAFLAASSAAFLSASSPAFLAHPPHKLGLPFGFSSDSFLDLLDELSSKESSDLND